MNDEWNLIPNKELTAKYVAIFEILEQRHTSWSRFISKAIKDMSTPDEDGNSSAGGFVELMK